MRGLSSIVFAALAAILGSACTTSASTDRESDAIARPRATADVLVLGTSDGPVLVDAGTAAALGDGAATLPAPDGTQVYTTTADQGSTHLVTRDAATGDIVAETDLDGVLDVRVASVSGEAVALMDPLPDGMDPWTPIPRASTTIVVTDPSGSGRAQRLKLDGNYEPEAFSADDQMLFLIQHLPAEAPEAYRVTTLDLESGDIRPVKGRFKVPPQRMPGTRLQQVFDPATAQLYTLYTNEATNRSWNGGESASGGGYGSEGGYGSGGEYGGSGGNADRGSDGDVTFVHVLNLREGWAFCAGVPRSFWGQPANALALATSPDGSVLYLVDSVTGVVSEMNTRSLEIERTHEVDLGSLDGSRTSAAVSADGSVLYVGSASDGNAVYTLDTATLEPIDRWDVGDAVRDLRLSIDGERLYAALDEGIALLDPDDGTRLGSVAIGGIDEILHVATPVPAG